MGTISSLSVFTRRSRSTVYPDFSRLAEIHRDLIEIGIIKLDNTIWYLNQFLAKPEIMAIPSIKRLFWTLSMGWEIRPPIVLFQRHYLGEDSLAYIASLGEGHEKHVIFADEIYGPFRFVKLNQDGNSIQFRIWRNQQMYLLWPDIRGQSLEEYLPEPD